MTARKSAVWSEYTIDPLKLIGKCVTVIRIKRLMGRTAYTDGIDRVELHQTISHGIVQGIFEDRGKASVHADDPWEEAAADMHDGSGFADEWPRATITLTHDEITFDPEQDWVRIEWEEPDTKEESA